MRVITKQLLVETVAKRWETTYRDNGYIGKGRWLEDRFKFRHQQLLLAKSEEEITAIIGNSSWTRNECDECRKDCQVTVAMGDGYGEYPSERFCLDCLQKALEAGRAAE